MDLDVFDKVIKHPVGADIERALGATAFPKGWFITLDNGDASLEAMAQPDGSFIVIYAAGKQRRKAHADAATLKAVFLKYLARDPAWQNACTWDAPPRANAGPPGGKLKFVPDKRTLTGRNSTEPPAWAIVAMIGLFGIISFLASWPQVAYWLFPSAAQSDYFWVGLIFLPVVALLVLAAAHKGFEFHRAASWSQTSGRIVSSAIEQRRHQFQDEPATIENFTAVTYEFTANGRKVRGSRIGIGDDYRGADAAPKLARYPAGAVVTVYYDPDDPRNCVLERGGPEGLEARGCIPALLELAVAGGLVWALIAYGPDWVRAHFPHANANFAVAIFGFGLLLAMMCYAHWRRSKQAQGWPSTPGKIVESKVETSTQLFDGKPTTLYRPAVTFAYDVGGQSFQGNRITLGVSVEGTQAAAERIAAKYPEGGVVEVHYEPANPANAALENPGGMAWYLLLLALGCLALAVWQLQVF